MKSLPQADVHPHSAHQTRLAAGQACLDAALAFLALDITPLCCCDPDHVSIRKTDVGRAHAKICKPRDYGKVPMGTWKDLQTRLPSEAEVRGWWKNYDIGNLGIVLGQGSGVVRIDSDGAAGAALLHEWSRGDLPPTWAFLSPSGGHGWLYRWPKDVPCTTTATATRGTTHEELRLMANGSQTIVPPSRHKNGGVYTWVPGHSPLERELAPAPPWLRARLHQPVAEHPTAPSIGPRTADYDRVMQALALIPNDDAPYDDWLMIGMALHHTQAPWAREAWDTWSKGSTKYDAEKQEKSWASFLLKKQKMVTLGSLFHRASPPDRQDVPDMTQAPPSITGYANTSPSITGWPTTPAPIQGWAPPPTPITGWQATPLTLGDQHA